MKKSIVIVALFALGQLTALAVPQYEIENVTHLFDYSTFQTLAWDHTSQKLAAITNHHEIWTCNLTRVPITYPDDVALIADDIELNALSAITWKLDGSGIVCAVKNGGTGDLSGRSNLALVSTSPTGKPPVYEVDLNYLKPSDFPEGFGFNDENFDVRGPYMASTDYGDKLICQVLHWELTNPVHTEGVYALDLDASGDPIGSSAVPLIDTQINVLLVNPVLLSNGVTLFERPWLVDNRQEWAIDTRSALAGSGPIELPNPLEPNGVDIFCIAGQTAGVYAMTGTGSADGSVHFFIEAVGYNEHTDPMHEADFAMYTVTWDGIQTGAPAQEVTCSANLGPIAASPGGIRVAWFTAQEGGYSSLNLGTVKVTDEVQTVSGKAWSRVVASDFRLRDGSWGELVIPEGTEMRGTGLPHAAIRVSMSTPISPLASYFSDPIGIVPPRRVVRGVGRIEFLPLEGQEVTISIAYSNQEVSEDFQDYLQLFQRGEAKSVERIDFTNIPGENRIEGVVTVLDVANEFVVTTGLDSSVDTDGDGLTDAQETQDLDPYTPGDQNPFDPNVADSTGDNGSDEPDGIDDGQNDYDGDGMTNAEEFSWGFNPLDPSSYGQLPASFWPSLLLLTLVVGVSAIWLIRQRQWAR